ncbi:MAG: transcriptional regulator NrdR [Deltaproteobacteria bacterium]|nr:transcriptional regulator NrdR [Deltaproteobacteria bacterium]
MDCPFCPSEDTRVVDSRLARAGRAIRRRRSCETCGERFTTYEVVEDVVPDVIKENGRTEPFNREKVLRSVRLPCQKRPVGIENLTAFVDRLEGQVAAMPGRTVKSRVIGDLILDYLRDQDAVAYVRYASVYRSFSSVDEFMDELKKLQDQKPTSPSNKPSDP